MEHKGRLYDTKYSRQGPKQLKNVMLQWIADSWLNVSRHDPEKYSGRHGLSSAMIPGDTRALYLIRDWWPTKYVSVSWHAVIEKKSCDEVVNALHLNTAPTPLRKTCTNIHAQKSTVEVCSTSRQSTETALRQSFEVMTRASASVQHADPLNWTTDNW